jgi:sugar phosphate isomerase/epimerase
MLLKFLSKNSIKAELAFEYGFENYSISEHREFAKIILNELPGAAIHLPYGSINPGRKDDDGQMLKKITRALEIAFLYHPEHLVGHPNYDRVTDRAGVTGKFFGLKKTELLGPAHRPSQIFLERSITFWQKVLDSSPAKLYLENTYEHSPLPILTLIASLGERVGYCLDIGHWYHFAMGRHWDNFKDWLDLAGDKVNHLHLHDNNGDSDQHIAVGDGLIDYPAVFTLINQYCQSYTYTVENYRLEDLKNSFKCLEII